MQERIFFHGTSDVFDIKKYILPPVITNNKREEWRQKDLDKVFFTSSKPSAVLYAKKACKKYGGNPIVYVVKPIGQYFNTVNTEYISNRAMVVNKLFLKDS